MSHAASEDDLSFDQATLVHPRVGDTDFGDTVFDVAIHPLWTVGDKPNGGYLLALLGRAAAECLRHDGQPALDPLSATITYLSAPALSAAEIRTAILRRGRTASHVRTSLVQAERTLVDAVFVMGTVPGGVRPRYNDLEPLDIPDPESCVRLPAITPDGLVVGIMETTDLRLDPATAPEPPDTGPPQAELRGWVRFSDRTEPDPHALLYFVDAIPPATLRIGSTGWVPTLSMSVYVRAQPAPGWLGIRFTAHLVGAGMVDETCTLWDSTGQVVAQATQLARLRFPDEVH